jgi:hypothetical protein
MATTYEPKVMEIPGIPGKVQEMTLDQYMGALQPTHLARRQLEDIRGLALDSMKTTQQLIKAFERINDLETQLKAEQGSKITTVILDKPETPSASELYEQIGKTSEPVEPVEPAVPVRKGPIARGEKYPKEPCPTCGTIVSCNPAAWHKHMKEKHGLTGVPNPIHKKST